MNSQSTKPTDCQVIGAQLYFLPGQTRMPLKFGTETLTAVTCARVAVTVSDRQGRTATGWGETPLSVQWVWPGALAYEVRHDALRQFCQRLASAWVSFGVRGDPIEVGYAFQQDILGSLLQIANQERGGEPMPWLAALVCCSPFDLAVHDAFGRLLQRPTYQTYTAEYLNRDLSAYLQPAAGVTVSFDGLYPADFLSEQPLPRLRAWHLVAGLDPLNPSDLTGKEPSDGYPVLIRDWIRRDGLKCLKIKLRGNDAEWDYQRLVRVGLIAAAEGVDWLSADFNCTVSDPNYVNNMLDLLRDHYPRIYGMLLYVEQPFPYELELHPIDVHSVSARKPLFLDESAHDWKQIRHGRELGWTGVALKTCKTQTGAILSACWARSHGLGLMVQDLSNPMLAQIPHVLLASHVGTIMGVETNSMQFYPEASKPEFELHPGLFKRRAGELDLKSLGSPGLGYGGAEWKRNLGPPQVAFGAEPVGPPSARSRSAPVAP